MSPALEGVALPKPYDWWANVLPMDRIPFLVELRAMILEQSNTRMPRWRVRYSADLAAVIQPRPEFAVMKGDPVFLWIAAQGHPLAAGPDAMTWRGFLFGYWRRQLARARIKRLEARIARRKALEARLPRRPR